MKAFNLLFSLLFSVLLLVGCATDDEPNYAELLKGTWINTLINGQPLLTDETFVMELKPDNTEMYAIGFQLDENNKSWIEGVDYTYSIVGDHIVINGTDVLGNAMQMEFKIESLTDETLTFTVPTFKVNNVEVPNDRTFTCKKITDDYRTAFTGVWYGRCTTEGTADSTYHYWEHLADGRYFYYYQDENDNWIKKTDNEGRYYLYGNLMACNYTNDLLTGGTGKVFECWHFTIDGSKMVWTGLRENAMTITYEMDKVPSAPQTIQ